MQVICKESIKPAGQGLMWPAGIIDSEEITCTFSMLYNNFLNGTSLLRTLPCSSNQKSAWIKIAQYSAQYPFSDSRVDLCGLYTSMEIGIISIRFSINPILNLFSVNLLQLSENLRNFLFIVTNNSCCY